jgi:hypothetical protein
MFHTVHQPANLAVNLRQSGLLLGRYLHRL